LTQNPDLLILTSGGNMSPRKIRKTLLNKIDDEIIASEVSKALRQAYTELTTAIKWIERITDIEAETASKWYRGLHTPNSAHLMTLAGYYPEVLQALCILIGRKDLWHAAMQNNIPHTMRTQILEKHPNHRFRGDKSVTPKGRADSKIQGRFNQRQMWFLEQLQRGYKLQTKDIMIIWDVHMRTAKRDVAGLIAGGWIRFVASGNTGWYVSR
jgi:hypothetical protein